MFLFCFFLFSIYLFILGNCLWLMILSLFKLNEIIFHSSQNCMWLTFNFFNRIILIFLIFNFVIFIDSNPHSFLVCFAWDFEYPIHIEGRYSQDFLFFVFCFFLEVWSNVLERKIKFILGERFGMFFRWNDGWSKGGLLEHVLGRSWVHILEDSEHVLAEFRGLSHG